MVMKIDLKESFLRAFAKIKYDKNPPTKSGKKAKGLFLPPLSRYPPYSTHMIEKKMDFYLFKGVKFDKGIYGRHGFLR